MKLQQQHRTSSAEHNATGQTADMQRRELLVEGDHMARPGHGIPSPLPRPFTCPRAVVGACCVGLSSIGEHLSLY